MGVSGNLVLCALSEYSVCFTYTLVYPGEHHGGWTTFHSKDFLERRLDWYDRYVKGENPDAADEADK